VNATILHRSDDFDKPATLAISINGAEDLSQRLIHDVDERVPHELKNKTRLVMDQLTNKNFHSYHRPSLGLSSLRSYSGPSVVYTVASREAW